MSRQATQFSLDDPPLAKREEGKLLISLAIAAFNEASLLEKHLKILCDYLASLDSAYVWEIILVNDGSEDHTGALAEQFAENCPQLRVVHHRENQGLGKALQTAFSHCKGDYIVTLDIDLSYSPSYIGVLLRKMRESDAKIVIASPTLEEGRMEHLPWYRKGLTWGANVFLSSLAKGKLTNLTSMMRVYEGSFIRSLPLRSGGMEIMPEILNKALALNEKVEEIPAVLDWKGTCTGRPSRTSIKALFRHSGAILFMGFLFRPPLFFLLPGCVALICGLGVWLLFPGSSSWVLLPLGVLLISLGALAALMQHYYEELFTLAMKIWRDRGS